MSNMDVPASAELDEYEPTPERDEEAPEADAAEQRADAKLDQPRDERLPDHIPFDANEADATEQHRAVEGDEDDYR